MKSGGTGLIRGNGDSPFLSQDIYIFSSSILFCLPREDAGKKRREATEGKQKDGTAERIQRNEESYTQGRNRAERVQKPGKKGT